MANPEHVKILRAGVFQWNQWRQGNPSITPDLSYASFPRANFKSINFSQSNLEGINLSYSDLSHTNLKGANLKHASLVYTNLSHANLSGAILSHIKLQGAILEHVNFTAAIDTPDYISFQDWHSRPSSTTEILDVSEEAEVDWLKVGEETAIELSWESIEPPMLNHNASPGNTGFPSVPMPSAAHSIGNGSQNTESLSPTVSSSWFSSIVDNLKRTKQKPHKMEETLEISLLHPKRLAKGFSSVIDVSIYLPKLRQQVVERHQVRQLQEKKVELTEIQHDSHLQVGQTVYIQLSSPSLKFSDTIVKSLKAELNTTSFTAIPNDNCQPGRHSVLLTIKNADSQVELEAIAFSVLIDDYAFDHMSKPLVSKISSTATSIASVVMFLLTYLEQVDKSLGIPAGTAAAMAAMFWGIRPTLLYKQQKLNSSP